jgi:hypothetical protein
MSRPGEASTHPIQLVVTDDLRRSRLTAVFRLLLALPHVVWLLLWSLAVFLLWTVVWLVVVASRSVPEPLHRFLARYVRYATQVGAFVTLAADPFPAFTGAPGYPVDLEIAPPAPQRRAGALFRLVLAVPALLLAAALGNGLWGGGGSWSGGTTVVAAVLAWFACLASGRMPQGLRDLAGYGIGYSAQTLGYALFLTDRYPCADPALAYPPPEVPPHPVAVRGPTSLGRSRLLVLFRLLLLLPHLLWLALWSVAVVVVAAVAWLAALVTGSVPTPVARFLAAYTRYGAHVASFGYLVGDPFPGFSGAAGAYPVDVTTAVAGRQPRWTILFRLPLAIPALLVAGAYGGVLSVVALLAWFAGLVTGRMPSGIQAVGVAAVRYSAQTTAYLLLVTDRYPFASPGLETAYPPPLEDD